MDERERILVVDDDESICTTLRLIFQKKGYETETVGTGGEAIEKARERFFNAALLDIKLPDVEGTEILSSLKEMHPDMAVLMATGHASLDSAVQALNAGASAYVMKPLNMDEVLGTLGEALEKQRLVMENRRLYLEVQRELAERKRAEEALRRRAALDRVRVSAYEMKETADIQKVLTSLYEALQDIGVEFDHCSVQTVDEERGLFRIAWQAYGKQHYIGPDNELAMDLPLAGTVVYEAWREQRVVYRRDLAEEDPYRERTRIEEAYDKDIRSVVDVPFFYGTIAINSLVPETFSEEDIETLQQFAGVLSEAYTRFEDIQRIEESEEALRENQESLRQKVDELSALNNVDRVILNAFDRDAILNMLCTQFIEVHGFRSLTIALVDEEQGVVIHVKAAIGGLDWGLDHVEYVEQLEGVSIDLGGRNILAEVARTGKMEVIVGWDDRLTLPPDYPDVSDFPVSDEVSYSANKVSYFIPLKARDKVIGVLCTGSREAEKEEKLEQLKGMERILDHIALALQHIQMVEQLKETQVELERRHRELEERNRMIAAFGRIGQATLSSLDLDTALDTLMEEIVGAGIFRSLMIALVDEQNHSVTAVNNIYRNAQGNLLRSADQVGRRYDLDEEDPTAETARTGKVQVIEGWDDRFSRFDTPEAYEDRVSYFIPVRSGERVLAVLATGSTVEQKEEMLRKIESMDPLLDQVAIALEHSRLHGELEESEERLQEYSEHLEERVKERTRELRDAQGQLVRRERLAVLGQLAGGVGHDLRNPLGVIKNAVYFLNMVIDEPAPEVKEMLEILDKEVGTCEGIISSLLDFARPKPLSQQPVDVNEVVREALSRTTVPENVEVVSELDEALPTIPADPVQLGQVFGNILLNGVQAMPEGGRLTVTSEAASPEWVLVSFTDTGVGISEENLSKLFEPLFTTKARGIGLGLALTRTLVERHRGTVDVKSEEGEGSTFIVRLPVAGEPVRSEADAAGDMINTIFER